MQPIIFPPVHIETFPKEELTIYAKNFRELFLLFTSIIVETRLIIRNEYQEYFLGVKAAGA